MAQLNFNTEGIEIMEDFSPLPKGYYKAVIVSSEIKTAQSGKGQYLSLEFEIIEGKYSNRKIFSNLNIRHTNEVAQQIGQRELATICRAVGKNTIQDSSELHMKPMMVTYTPCRGKTPSLIRHLENNMNEALKVFPFFEL